MTELKAKGTCDFCGEVCNADTQGAKAYDCEDFPMALTGAMSYGAWGACPACAALIDSEHWHALEDRMTQKHAEGLKRELNWLGFRLVKDQLEQMRRTHAENMRLFRRHRRYVDPQEGTQTFYPQDSMSAEASLIVETWETKPPNTELWFVFVTCEMPGQELRFVYPITADPGTDASAVLRDAQAQHSKFGRPLATDIPEIVHVTAELVADLTLRSWGTGDLGLCDFCGATEKERKAHPCRDFRLPNGKMSVGGWAACSECSALIDTGDQDGLVARMLSQSGATDETHDMELLSEVFWRNVRGFFANRAQADGRPTVASGLDEPADKSTPRSVDGLHGIFGQGGRRN